MDDDSDMMEGSQLPEGETSAPGIDPDRRGDSMEGEPEGDGMREESDADMASDPGLDPDPVRDANPETDGVG